MNVYFISGMCVNCGVFDKIELPENCTRSYIEWSIPKKGETIEEYAFQLSKKIDLNKPFVIVGYSLGGIIMQEMNKFIHPEKNILISSIKAEKERPLLFKIAKASHILKHIPQALYSVNKTLSNAFTRLIYDMTIEEIEEYVSYTSSIYMKWATCQITEWLPSQQCDNLYHIHGTKDQIFPYKHVSNAYTIKEGDHLMVMRKHEEVSKAISEILLK
ncbi:alpha/beta hydrolase [Dysgonomonas capnocytophagoides]|uniref:alpha/beta hydrolase n=1 Tax=Dysgonomonas capnocytophagoides TaxID=45254 RepID=UPI003340BFF8